MKDAVNVYWKKRLDDLKENLEENNFEVFIAESAVEAKEIVINSILPHIQFKTVSWGGSMTVVATGITDIFKTGSVSVINPYEPNIAPEEAYERRRQALLSDLYFTGTNAITEEGYLVNLDMTGNRVGALNFGPKNVIVLIGRNKIVAGLKQAMMRIKNFASPTNAMRLDKKTPCTTTSVCQDCKSPERICNVWTVTEKSYPKNRIRIVLINQDLGL